MDKSLFYDDAHVFSRLSDKFAENNIIPQNDFSRFPVKRGLRNSDGTGVMVGLTKICNVEGYYIDDGERVPKPGRLIYRGIDLYDFVGGCKKDDRFGFEELIFLLIFGSLPTKEELDGFCTLLSANRELPFDFVEDVIMRAPSPNIMNKMASSVTALYAYDDDPDNISVENVLRQSIQLIAQLPAIMSYAYQVKRRFFYKKSMYIHQVKPEQKTAEVVLRSIRSDKTFTDKEAKLLDLCLMIHADHGGGNNSTFTTRCISSTGTDTYSAIGAGIGSLKGFRHGGANIKVTEMVEDIFANVNDVADEDEVKDYLRKIVRKEVNDHSGLIYGMGHAIYTLSDPRAVLLKQNAKELAEENGLLKEWNLLDCIERLAPAVFAEEKGISKQICANVDLYSGLVYRTLGIPEDLYTPMFAVARVAGWCAHRLEEVATCSRIMRPAYKSIARPQTYKELDTRTATDSEQAKAYIPKEER
ncbi:MAG: citrate/2-methylcitrate synthase [Clostridia bacterium]|nr:citrate/2-methylcitrate synthase [Clostridia bacterium]